MGDNMIRRVLFAVVAIPLLVGVVWVGDWVLVALLIVAATVGIAELFQLAERAGTKPLLDLGRFFAALIPIALILIMKSPETDWLAHNWTYLALLAALVPIGAVVFSRAPLQRPLAAIAITLFGVIYTSLLPSMLLVIRHAQWGSKSWTGTAVVFFPLLVTWVCDTAAMLGGQAIGGPKMAPAISPGKTRAGGIAGIVGGTAVGALYAFVIFPRVQIDADAVSVMGLACLVSIVGQIGDLVESLFKREAGVKDSSALIPGHGGVLDRLDSLYFAIPAAAVGFHFLGVI